MSPPETVPFSPVCRVVVLSVAAPLLYEIGTGLGPRGEVIF
jgi:hypothetical protein